MCSIKLMLKNQIMYTNVWMSPATKSGNANFFLLNQEAYKSLPVVDNKMHNNTLDTHWKSHISLLYINIPNNTISVCTKPKRGFFSMTLIWHSDKCLQDFGLSGIIMLLFPPSLHVSLIFYILMVNNYGWLSTAI